MQKRFKWWGWNRIKNIQRNPQFIISEKFFFAIGALLDQNVWKPLIFNTFCANKDTKD